MNLFEDQTHVDVVIGAIRHVGRDGNNTPDEVDLVQALRCRCKIWNPRRDVHIDAGEANIVECVAAISLDLVRSTKVILRRRLDPRKDAVSGFSSHVTYYYMYSARCFYLFMF